MNGILILNTAPAFIEIGPLALKVLRGGKGIEFPLERDAGGKLTAACRERLIGELRTFLDRKSWQPRVKAYCGLSAHGVSLRRFHLPPATKENITQVLHLQIESEFPLPPDELAWGWRDLAADATKREVLVVAVRKEVVSEWRDMLAKAGANAEFTAAAFARNALCPANESHAVLELGASHSEIAEFVDDAPVALGILPRKLDGAAGILQRISSRSIYLCGQLPAQSTLLDDLSAGAICRRLEIPSEPGHSAATLGLQKIVEENLPLLRLSAHFQAIKTRFDFSRPETRQWLIRAAVLLVLLLLLPYAEAFVFKPLLARKLEHFQKEKQHFESVVDPELTFLQYLKRSQPPYLDAIYVLAKAAPHGMRLESLSIGQQGDISLKATLQSAQQVMDFRAKLIASGFFSTITVLEQTVVPHQRKVNLRMTAQWKPAGTRKRVTVKPAKTKSKLPAPPTAGKHSGETNHTAHAKPSHA